MLEKLRKERGDEGFTLIELLVVIIIIGILAAIAIPVFLNQRQKGWEAAVQSDLRNAATAQETYLTENATYTTNMVALQSMGFKYSDAKNYAKRRGHHPDGHRRHLVLPRRHGQRWHRLQVLQPERLAEGHLPLTPEDTVEGP